MSVIWFEDYSLNDVIEKMNMVPTQENLVNHIGLELTDIGADYLKGRIPVDARTHQVHGILHGGATCVLAETLGSVASLLCIDLDRKYAVGSVITANHLRPVTSGHVTGICKPVHIGRTKHVWDIQVLDDREKLIAKCELTCAVIAK